MKKMIVVLVILLMVALCFTQVYKDIDVEYGGKQAKIARIEYARELSEGSYCFVVTLLDADSTVITTNNYYDDTNAPFQLETEAELDTLLKLHPNYIPVEEE